MTSISSAREPFLDVGGDSSVDLDRELAPTYIASPKRWFILFAFSLTSFAQSLTWITYSPIADCTKAYYHIADSEVDLLLNWGSIIFVPAFFPVMFISEISPRKALRRLTMTTCVCVLLCAVLRLMPIWFKLDPHSNGYDSFSRLVLLVFVVLPSAVVLLHLSP